MHSPGTRPRGACKTINSFGKAYIRCRVQHARRKAADGTRTRDLVLTKDALYQLSYSSTGVDAVPSSKQPTVKQPLNRPTNVRLWVGWFFTERRNRNYVQTPREPSVRSIQTWSGLEPREYNYLYRRVKRYSHPTPPPGTKPPRVQPSGVRTPAPRTRFSRDRPGCTGQS